MVSPHSSADDQGGMVARGGVAITGMAGLFPGAPDVDAFWHNITHKVDTITDPPPEAWEVDVFYDPASSANDRVYCKKGGYLGRLACFDPLKHGVMPLAVQGGEPDQWLALRVARAALTDAGYGDDIPEGHRTAVILGKGTYLNRGNGSGVQHGIVVDQTLEVVKKLHPEFSADDLASLRAELKKDLPPFNADTVPGLIPNIIAGRIANRLDLMGPTYTVDAACASSLIAVDMAVRDLLSGDCDLALAGGSHVVTPVPVMMVFCHLGALSRHERIRPFDRDADGTILGEGIGMVVLKRLEDAHRAGDRIYAVIRGVGVASDGRGLSVTAPRLEGELTALQRAYERAGVSPQTVGLIEAHGTGTPVGDATEIRALSEMFGPRDSFGPWCALGSVKSNIGHLMPAAGIAGLIKAALALYHRVLPPTLNVDAPDPQLELAKTPFYVNTDLRPWIHRSAETPRRAGVNSCGFGGINAHVVLEEPPPGDPASFRSRQLAWETEVFLLRGQSREELVQQAKRLSEFLEKAPDARLLDLAFTLNVARADASQPACLSLVASSTQDLREKLERTLNKLTDPRAGQIKTVDGITWTARPLGPTGTLAFLFPGEGSQYINMLADLCIHFPEVRAQFDLVDRLFAGHARDYVPSDYLFPPPAFTPEVRKAAEERIWQMDGAVEAVLTANRALALLLDRLQIRPAAALGHSTGEYSAMLASGMIRADDEAALSEFALDLNRFHQRATGDAAVPRAVLLAAGADVATVSAAIAESQGQLFVAMDNCPHQTVVVGPEEAITSASERLRSAGLITERLPFDRPYHTPLFEAVARQLEPFFARWLTGSPGIPVYTCATAAPFPADPARAREIAVEHWLRPVAFTSTIEAMYADGVRIFVEVGPKGNLTAFVDDILRGRPHLAVPADVMHRSGLSQLNHLVAMLAVHGVSMRLDYLYAHRIPAELDLDRPDDPYHVGSTQGKPLKLATGWPAMRLSEEKAAELRSKRSPAAAARTSAVGTQPRETPAAAPMVSAPASGRRTASAPQPSASSQVMAAHLQAMEQFLVVQEEVMRAFLAGRMPGAAPPVSAATVELQAPEAVALAPGVSPGAPAPETGRPSPVLDQAPSGGADKGQAEAPAGTLSAAAIAAILIRLVSERTGYPPEMLDLNLDLEASLGIDSIKRVEILGLLRRETGLLQPADMEGLTSRKTLQGIVDFLAGAGPPATTTSQESATVPLLGDVVSPQAEAPVQTQVPELPFLRRVLAFTPGSELVARCDIDLAEDLFLLDHTLGRRVSLHDAQLRGLPLMPFTMSMEMLAESAAALLPGLHLVGMRDVRASRWIALDGERLTVEMVARRDPAGPAMDIQTQLFEIDPNGNTVAVPLAEARMIFGASYPEAPAPKPFALVEEHPSRWQPEQLYTEVMFHGPIFRGVRSIDRTGSDGAVATVEVRNREGLLRSNPQPSLVTDPVLLDQPGQVVGFWTAEHLADGYVIFPFHLEALHLYGDMPDPGRRLECRVRIELVGERQLRSDLDLVDPDLGTLLRFEGWEDRRFELPDDFFHLLMSPQDVVLSQPWPALASLCPDPGAQAYRVDLGTFAKGFFTVHGGIWQRTLAGLILSHRERALWRGLETPEPRRIEWLLARLAAKDAVRSTVQALAGLTLAPADVEILPDPNGRPVVAGSWLAQTGCTCQVSLAHAAGTAVAVAADSAAGIGVDIEHIAHMRVDIGEVAFTAAEKSLLRADALSTVDDWPLRLWCAKEAAAKAIGSGMLGGPQSLEAQSLDPAQGTVDIALRGTLVGALPESDGRTVTVHTTRQDDFVMALARSTLDSPPQIGEALHEAQPR